MIHYLIRPYGQAVKTPPFHGGIPSSNLGRVTKQASPAHKGVVLQHEIPQNEVRGLYKSSALRKYSSVGRASALQAGGHRFEPCYFHQIYNLLSFRDIIYSNVVRHKY